MHQPNEAQNEGELKDHLQHVSPQELAARKQWAQEVKELEDATGRRAESSFSLSVMPPPPPPQAPNALPLMEGPSSSVAQAGAAAAAVPSSQSNADDSAPSASTAEAIAPGPIQFDVTFESERLGMGLAEAKNRADLPFINVAPSMRPTEGEGGGFVVQVGDRVKAVNGVPLLEVMQTSSSSTLHAAALHAIRTGGRPMVLTFERDHPTATLAAAATTGLTANGSAGGGSDARARSYTSLWWLVVFPLLLAGLGGPYLLASLHRHCAAPGSSSDGSTPTTHWFRGSSVRNLLPPGLLPESVSLEWVDPLVAEPLERGLGQAKQYACVAVQPGGQLAPYAEQALVWAQISEARAAAAGAAVATAVENHTPADLKATLEKWRARSSSFYTGSKTDSSSSSPSSDSSSGSGAREISELGKDMSGATAYMRAEIQEFGELLMGVAQELEGLRADMGKRVTGAFNQVSYSVQSSMSQGSEGSSMSSGGDSSNHDVDENSEGSTAESEFSHRYSYEQYAEDENTDAFAEPQPEIEEASNIGDYEDDEEAEPEMPDDIPNLPTAIDAHNFEGQSTTPERASSAAATESVRTGEKLDEATATTRLRALGNEKLPDSPVGQSNDEKASSPDVSEDVPVLAKYRVEGIDSTNVHAEL